MGGAVYSIAGRLRPQLIPNAPLPPSTKVPFWRRLLGTQVGSEPHESHLIVAPNGDRHFVVAVGPLERDLVSDFKGWLAQQLRPPSRASSVVLDYLEYGGPSIDVRGLKRSTDVAPSFWVQASFSGCAGEAQVSANVAAHWAGRWHRARQELIREAYLLPFGFTPEPPAAHVESDPAFLPAGDLGYVEHIPPESRERYRMPMFAMDHSLQEAFAGSASPARLEERFARLMTDARCRCQLCEPGLGDLAGTGSPART